jgi:hypothetical protein
MDVEEQFLTFCAGCDEEITDPKDVCKCIVTGEAICKTCNEFMECIPLELLEPEIEMSDIADALNEIS